MRIHAPSLLPNDNCNTPLPRHQIRDAELDVLKRNLYLNAVGTLSWVMAPFLVSIASFITYTVGMGMPLTAEKAFVSLSLFNLLRFPLAMLPMLIAALVQASVAEKRLAKFLSAKETNPNNVQIVPTPHNYGPSGDSGSNGNSKVCFNLLPLSHTLLLQRQPFTPPSLCTKS